MTTYQVAHDRQDVGHYPLELPDEDHIGAKLAGGYPYEHQLLRSLAALLEDGDVMLDVGAHVGNHSVYLALACDIEVHAFEPNPPIFELLISNVAANGLAGHVTCHRLALGDTSSSGTMGTLIEGNSGSSFVTETEGGSVRIEPLSSIYDGPVRLVKIDVEGFEESVIRGASDHLRRHRPILALELARDAPNAGATRALLRSMGYRRVSPNLAATPTYLFAARLPDALRIGLLPQVRGHAIRWAKRRAKAWILTLKGARTR